MVRNSTVITMRDSVESSLKLLAAEEPGFDAAENVAAGVAMKIPLTREKEREKSG